MASGSDSRSLLRVDASVIIQGAILAALVWFGNKVVTVSETVAVHEFRIATLEQQKK